MMPPKSLLSILLVLLLASSVAACGEEEGELSNQNNDNQTTNNDTNGNNANNGEEQWDEGFVEVAEIIRSTCAAADCHGATSAPETVLEFGADGQDLAYEDIEFVFENFAVGDPLVDPGNPEGSLLYQSITSEDPDELMPPGQLELSQAQIDAVHSWIADGAKTR